jgi:uncharacterized phage protein (TIGR01671 family)
MKREIKFRVWDGSKMVYNIIAGIFGVFYVNPGSNKKGLDPKDSASLTPFNTKYPDDTPVMQFTGLHDKNGKEIYEGDIVKWYVNDQIHEGIVEYVDGYGGYDMKHFEDKYHVCCDWFRGQYEVIGNIYENPKLINQ